MADFEQTLNHAQKQQQQLSVRQLQSLELLNLPLLDLQDKIAEIAAANPVIEIEETEPPEPLSEVPSSAAGESGDESELSDGAAEAEEWADELPLPPSGGGDENAGERHEFLMNSLSGTETLQEQLAEELQYTACPPKLRTIALQIIDSIDDSGYFRSTAADLAMSCQATVEEVKQALKIVQSFDPPGIGAGDLAECLHLQLERAGRLTPELELLLAHLDEVRENGNGALAGRLGMSQEKLAENLKILRSLSPFPGAVFPGRDAIAILPEVSIVRKGEEYEIIPRRPQRIFTSPQYEEMAKDPELSPETRSYLKEKFQQANELIRAIELRESTIVRIAGVIVASQREFLEKGVSALKPLTMHETGRLLQLHETTISRAVAGKYVQTPQGVYPFRYFFSGGYTSDGGEALSSRALMEKLRQLIDDEDPRHPFSDEQLSLQLKKAGFPVARRTVAKYRELLKIPGTARRKLRS